MKAYLVGGAVRDRLLGLPVKDRDWVVTGQDPDAMLAAGYRSVGKDFPVFLHPKTHEEYALARTERKSGRGYHGFVFHADSSVTLEEDLLRRDLTINAIAEDTDSQLIDPSGGQQDLENRILRHVSPAFAEDPVRILRIARFLARFHALGFTIADETMGLMRDMVTAGEVDELVPERVWQETCGALGERDPDQFFKALRECGALKILFPELDQQYGKPQVAKHHPEIDTGIHTMMVLQQCCLITDDKETRFASLCHDFGKGITPDDVLPHHYGHEEAGLPLVTAFCDRLKVPNKYRQLAEITCRYHTHVHRAFEQRPKTLLKVMEKTDAFRKPERFNKFLLACRADARGRTGFEDRAYEQADLFAQLLDVALAVDVSGVIADGFEGIKIKEELRRRRLRAIAAVRDDNSS